MNPIFVALLPYVASAAFGAGAFGGGGGGGGVTPVSPFTDNCVIRASGTAQIECSEWFVSDTGYGELLGADAWADILASGAGNGGGVAVGNAAFQSYGYFVGRDDTSAGTFLGSSVASMVELHVTNGNGLLVGTQQSAPLVLGTNNTARLTFGATGTATFATDVAITGALDVSTTLAVGTGDAFRVLADGRVYTPLTAAAAPAINGTGSSSAAGVRFSALQGYLTGTSTDVLTWYVDYLISHKPHYFDVGAYFRGGAIGDISSVEGFPIYSGANASGERGVVVGSSDTTTSVIPFSVCLNCDAADASRTYLFKVDGDGGLVSLQPAAIGLQLSSGNTNGGSPGDTQIVFDYQAANRQKHRIYTRHEEFAQAGNAIEFFVWQFGVDAAGALGTKQVLSLDATGSTFGSNILTTTSSVEGWSLYSNANASGERGVVAGTADTTTSTIPFSVCLNCDAADASRTYLFQVSGTGTVTINDGTIIKTVGNPFTFNSGLTAGQIISSGDVSGSSLTVSGEASVGNLKLTNNTLPTCQNGSEAKIFKQNGGGGTRTKACMCTTADGAAWAWQNLATAGVGDATTCP